MVHLGPTQKVPGGIASVIAVLVEGGQSFDHQTIETWEPGRLPSRIRIFVRAWRKLQSTPSETIVHAHASVGGSLLRKGLLLRTARRQGHRTAVTIHGSSFVAFARKHRYLTRWALAQSDVVFVLSPEIGDAVARLSPGASVAAIKNPVHLPPEAQDAACAPMVALFAGEVGIRKGFDVLAGAWPLVKAALPQAELVVAGPIGDLSPAVEGSRYLGSLKRDELAAEIESARVVVLPSRAEALPMVLIEAMAAARPFIATAVGDVESLARSGAGVLVRIGDAAALADALIALLSDETEASRMGRLGRAAVSEAYGVATVEASMAAHYGR